MDDLVKRLRGDGGPVDIPDIMHEAADEIEELREGLKSWAANVQLLRDETARLRAEIRTLTTAEQRGG